MTAFHSQSTPYCVVMVTCPTPVLADTLAEVLVKNRLAACVNIVPGVQSVYTWQDKLVKDTEVLMLIKTRQDLLCSLNEMIAAHHSYEVHECVALPILFANTPYLDWMAASLSEP